MVFALEPHLSPNQCISQFNGSRGIVLSKKLASPIDDLYRMNVNKWNNWESSPRSHSPPRNVDQLPAQHLPSFRSKWQHLQCHDCLVQNFSRWLPNLLLCSSSDLGPPTAPESFRVIFSGERTAPLRCH